MPKTRAQKKLTHHLARISSLGYMTVTDLIILEKLGIDIRFTAEGK